MATTAYDRGIRTGPLHSLRPVLEAWLRINNRAGREWVKYGAAPWWYNERASLSFFAGAVWQCTGGWALEEFSTVKIDSSERGRKQELSGRCDIDFGFGNYEYAAEAKQCWPNISNTSNSIAMVKRFLREAHQDCRQLPGYFECPRLSMVFATPKLHESRRAHIDVHLGKFVNELGRLQNAAVAWIFPKTARGLRPDGNYRNYIFPGIAVVVRRCN